MSEARSATPENEQELLERIRRDEPGAFDRLVETYGDRLLGFGMRVCGEREDARDVLQETLLQAFRSVKDLREPRALRSWLYRIASNACLMKRRRGKFEPDRELSLDELKPSPESASFDIPDVADLPDEAALRSQAREAVQRAIAGLPPHYRIVLVLRDMEQLSTREVAHALDLQESAVKMRLHRGRLAIRKELESFFRSTGAKEGESR